LRELPAYSGVLPLEDYKPPRVFSETLVRINKCVANKLDKDKLNPGQKKEVEILQTLLADPRFNFIINAYLNQYERDLFEGEFVKSMYNKGTECSNEEISQFLNLSNSVVIEAQYVAELNQYKEKAKLHLDTTDNVPKNISDRVSALESNIVEVKNYQDKLIKALQGERSKRIESKTSGVQSLVALIEAFKDEKARKKIAKFALGKDEKVREVFKEHETMDTLLASVWGLAEGEILPEKVENIKEGQ